MIGVGLDLVDVDRFRNVLQRRHKIRDRLFTHEELLYCNSAVDPAERLAVRLLPKRR